jgi:hypothetical protein
MSGQMHDSMRIGRLCSLKPQAKTSSPIDIVSAAGLLTVYKFLLAGLILIA